MEKMEKWKKWKKMEKMEKNEKKWKNGKKKRPAGKFLRRSHPDLYSFITSLGITIEK